MPIVLAVAGALLVYTLTGLLFQWLLGSPVRPGVLGREMDRLSAAGGQREPARWNQAVRAFFYPSADLAPEGLVRQLGAVAAGGFAVGALVFNSVPLGLFLSLGFIPARYYFMASLRRQRRDLLNLQLKDALFSIAGSLRTGASLPTAVTRSSEDMRRILHGQKQQPMVEELDRMIREMQLGGSVEDALIRFRDRVQLEDVTNFVNTALLCKTRGGNLPEVMATIAQIIGDKVGIRRQIQVLTAGKRMEATLLTSAPPAIVVILSLMSPDYMAPLFSTLLGQLLSALAVILLVGAFLIGRKMVEIEV